MKFATISMILILALGAAAAILIPAGGGCFAKRNPDEDAIRKLSYAILIWHANKGRLPSDLNSKNIHDYLINQTQAEEIIKLNKNNFNEFIDSQGNPFQFNIKDDSYEIISIRADPKGKDVVYSFRF